EALQDSRQPVDCQTVKIDFEIIDQMLRLKGACNRNQWGMQEDNVAIFSRGVPLAWIDGGDAIRADRITAALTPPVASIRIWNSIFLPSPPLQMDELTDALPGGPAARIRNVRRWTGEPPMLQR
ncbi:MAG: hypothetical protein AAGJ83_12455, partial [Planctomycetota bacterium]